MLIDAKFKEAQPLATVNRIRSALFDAGIFTVEKWSDSGINGCYSTRIEIAGTSIGQNGKGVTREFALASGYAEFMERLQSGYIYVGKIDDELEQYRGFISDPSEREYTIAEYIGKYGDELQPLAKRLGAVVVDEILSYCRYEHTLDKAKDFSAIPFRNIASGKVLYMPLPLLRDIYATNGTCAGNSEQEALVQGLSELMERNHNLRILTECITPPTVPEDYLQQFEAYGMIREICQKSQCELIVKDCSLGTGFPVIAAVFLSRRSHRYIVKFGAHPVFEIALERCLTEMLQGRNFEDASSTSTIAYSKAEVLTHDNIHNVVKCASGKYYYKFFTAESEEKFVPFSDRTGMDNAQLLDYCRKLYRDMGYEIYVRKCGYLQFPSYQIIVPGFSEIYNYGLTRLKERNSLHKSSEILNNLTEADDNQLRTLYSYLRYKENFALENTLSYTMRLPLMLSPEDDLAAYRYIEACLAFHFAKWKEALQCIQILNMICKKDKEYLAALETAARNMLAGNELEAAFAIIERFYSPEIISRVRRVFNWSDCARDIMSYCSKVQEASDAYEKYRSVRQALKDRQAECNDF